MKVPDYVVPVIGYRLWRWDSWGLRSFNDMPWIPEQPMAAQCRITRKHRAVEGLPLHDHDAPHADCRCGVYAAKRLDDLRDMPCWNIGVHGEVFLWGVIVEHELGWRAEFAYPKTLHLQFSMLPALLARIEARVMSLADYGCDISVVREGGSVPIWRKDSGFNPAALDS